jgi:hypothetical protein
MLTKSLDWKYVLPLLFAMALIGGVIGGVVVHYAFDDDVGLTRGSVIHLGPPTSLSSNPFCIETQHLCVAQLDSGEIRAFYMYDTHDFSRGEDCAVSWLPDFSFPDPDTDQETTGWFRSGCSGATFRLNGERVFGPAPRDLDRFEIKVLGPDGPLAGYLEVDTTHLICGGNRAGEDVGCPFAPLPQ